MKAKNFEEQFDVDLPTWMIDPLDREAGKLGVTRQSIIKVWLAERLEKVAKGYSSNEVR
jgi:hypothetical protein